MKAGAGLRQWLGSIAFTLYLFASVPFYAPVAVAAATRGRRGVYAVAKHWARTALEALQLLCGLGYRVEGRERLPPEASVVLMKHSSAWETLAQLLLFPEQTWVMKRELVWAPIFGWVLPLLQPIAIDRRGGREAVEQVLTQGRQRLEQGLWVVIFPEGTRVPRGETRRYGISGALLALETGRAVVPVAHDAGDYWPRRGWLKHRGTIRVVIGPPIETTGRDARAVTAEAQAWIESTLASQARAASRA